MLDIKIIRKNPEKVKDAIVKKNLVGTVDIDKLLQIDAEYTGKLQKVETHRALRNELSESISKVDADARQKLITEATKVKEELKAMDLELTDLENERSSLLKLIPNLYAEDVPTGAGEEENVVIKTWGKPKKFDFKPKDHMELGKLHGIIDNEKSAEVTGTRFNYLLGDAAMLQFALIQFTMEALTNPKTIKKLAKKVGNPDFVPFVPVVPPVMVRKEVMSKMDRLEPQDDRYVLEEDGLVLVGSAEHTMGPMLMNETLSEEELPKRFIGYSTAFRREAGSYGKDTKGILRVHQFDKLEMETFSTGKNGILEQELMVAVQEYLIQQLKIPYQVVMICTGDMGKPDYRQIDIECWMPGQDKFRETHTSDYMTDFQARRLNIRVKKAKGSEGSGNSFAHMNDATAIAIGRTLIAILENNQNKDGSVNIPKVLQKYVGKKVIKVERSQNK